MDLSKYGVTLRWRNVLLAVGIGGGKVNQIIMFANYPIHLVTQDSWFGAWYILYKLRSTQMQHSNVVQLCLR